MTRIPIRLQDESINALHALAKQEYRDIRQQAAWIIEQELQRRGLLDVHSFPAHVDPSPLGVTIQTATKRKPARKAETILTA